MQKIPPENDYHRKVGGQSLPSNSLGTLSNTVAVWRKGVLHFMQAPEPLFSWCFLSELYISW